MTLTQSQKHSQKTMTTKTELTNEIIAICHKKGYDLITKGDFYGCSKADLIDKLCEVKEMKNHTQPILEELETDLDRF